MKLPFEIIHLIYDYSDIDSKLSFHKIFNHNSFIHQKIHVPCDLKLLLHQLCSFKYTNYIMVKELSKHFSFL